jgi:hypothetical protein
MAKKPSTADGVNPGTAHHAGKFVVDAINRFLDDHNARVAVDRDRRNGYGRLRRERRPDRRIGRVTGDKLVAMPLVDRI